LKEFLRAAVLELRRVSPPGWADVFGVAFAALALIAVCWAGLEAAAWCWRWLL
jgi:hypothetical protein